MSTALNQLPAGFADPTHGSQQVFRTALRALSYPGRILPVVADAELPGAGHKASALLMLALLDADCTLWLSPRLATAGVGDWLRFHTGCRLLPDPATAHFIWVAQGDALPTLDCLQLGSDEDPHRAASCVIDVANLRAGVDLQGDWRLCGPGIAAETVLQVDALPADFAAQWARNHAAFPRGVDCWLALPHALLGLPRTVEITPCM